MWSCSFWKALWWQTWRRTSWQHNRPHTEVAHCCYSLHTSWEPNNCKWHSMYKRKVLTTILDESFLIVPSFMPKSLLRTLHHLLASCKWVGKLRKSLVISLMFLILISRQTFFLNEELYHTTPQFLFFTWLGISQCSLAWHSTRKLTVNYQERNQHIREHWTIAIRQNKCWLFHWLSLPALTTCIAGKKLTWLRTFPFLTMISQGMC